MNQNTTDFLRPPLTAGSLICAFLLAGLGDSDAQSQSEQISNVSPRIVKAYKTLNFGDNADTVEHKLTEIVANGNERTDIDNVFLNEIFWRSLFDTDAEYEPYKYDATHSTQSDKLESLMHYFRETVGGEVLSCGNTAISVNCYQLGIGLNTIHPQEHGGLAIVAVSYKVFDSDKLVDGFMQNFPNAQKENKSYRIESTMYPGVFLEFERTMFSDINPDRRATLSIPTEKFAVSFTELSKLSKDQLVAWETLMTQNDKTNVNEYFESVKTSLLELTKSMESEKSLDSLTYQGWYNSGQYAQTIYGAPSAVFASKQILGSHMNNYRQSFEDEDQKEKAKLKKESESSTGF